MAETRFPDGLSDRGEIVRRGVATVTGTLAITTGLTSITGAVLTMGADPGATAGDRFQATYTKSGGTLTAKVWQDDATASTQATAVSWVAWGT